MYRYSSKDRSILSAATVAAVLLFAGNADAYIGPGAGFAFMGSFFVMFTAIFVAAAALLVWPVRMLIFHLRRKTGGYKPTDVGRVVVVGLDGLDPRLVDRYMAEGRMPNFKKISESGSFNRLQTTCPSISPVAWSSFATGLTPAKHGIFDFLGRDLRTYHPVLSSAKIGKVEKFLKIGKYRFPLSSPSVKLLRKGTPFWHFLGEKGVSCSVIRVPITFPPEKYEGRVLSAMCAPDMRGSQGTFSYYSEDNADVANREGGETVLVSTTGDVIDTVITGPQNVFLEDAQLSLIPIQIRLNRAAHTAEFSIDADKFTLKEGVYSPWIRLGFPMMPGITAWGIARFLVTSTEPFKFYVTPINIDPEDPALPISHPKTYSIYLAKLLGSYATLGLAEDTWALNEGVISDGQFLEQALSIHAEREAMLMNELENVKKGLVVCVFDGTDRIQHMFWRYTDPGHPALAVKNEPGFEDTIGSLYADMDEMVGKVNAKLGPKDVLVVMSDHGFGSFRRGVNLNAWLHMNGYLALKEGVTPNEDPWFQHVDWSRTMAYAVGLGGICLNIKGRESKGAVPKAASDALKADISKKLMALTDPVNGRKAVRNVHDLAKMYSGPYLEGGPELFVGFDDGYRVSWECAKGVVDGVVFRDNDKCWSGDHCCDHTIVPGVLLSNRKFDAESPNIIDVAPTILKMFGLDAPERMDGKALY